MSIVDTALPPYSTKISTRAKHVRLLIKPESGLEIIVPKRSKKIDFVELINRNRLWIDKHLIKIAHQPRPAFASLPKQISLLAAEKTWQVHYQVHPTKRIICTAIDAEQLLLTGKIEDKPACRKVLCQWLIKQAQLILLPWLADLANLHQLTYKKAFIRQQKTRWGSCSKEKCINLNAKLLFFT